MSDALSAWLGNLLVCLGFCLFVLSQYWGSHPPDLSALYFAGHMVGTGNETLLYAGLAPGEDTYPIGWGPVLEDLGYRQVPIYPYVYPPLWAAIVSPLSMATSPTLFFGVAHGICAILICLTALIALRLAAPPGPRPLWLAFLLTALMFTLEGAFTFYHAQPQVLVGCLLLASFECERTGRSAWAGTLLALAAAIKLYPALFALYWMATRNRMALASFCSVGLGLAAASLAMAGADLHWVFLDRLATMRGAVNGTPFNFSIENILFQLTHVDVLPRDPDSGAVLNFTATDPHWVLPMQAGVVTTGLALLVWRWRGGSPLWRRRALIPAALILLSLCLPLGWVHQYVPVLFLMAGLAPLYGSRVAALIGMLILITHSSTLSNQLAGGAFPVMAQPLIGVASYLALFFVFAFAPRDGPTRSPAAKTAAV